MKKLLLAVGFLLLPVTAALAANCVPFTYTLTNGTTADANQVMSNFNTLLNCSNNNLAHNGSNSDITQLTGLTTPLTVPEGGTGLGTLTANSLMIGNGTSTPNFLTSSTTGALPFWTGTAWGAAALTAGPNISITNSSSGVTIAAAAAAVKFCRVTFEEPSGTAGEAYAATSWNIVNFNTVSQDPSSLVTISAKKITLAAGTYVLRASVLLSFSFQTYPQIRIYNSTTALYVAHANGVGGGDGTASNVGGVATIETIYTSNGTDALEVDIYPASAPTIAPQPTSTGNSETYAQFTALQIN